MSFFYFIWKKKSISCHNYYMKKIILLSAFVATTFLIHYFYISKLDQSGREVAAFAERNSDQQVKWEQKIASELSNNKEQVQVAVKPNWQDQLVYEFFKGQYDVVSENGQIQKLTLQNTQPGVFLNSMDLIKRFGADLKSYDSYQVSTSGPNSEEIKLFDKSKKQIGVFKIFLNDKGAIQEFIVQ